MRVALINTNRIRPPIAPIGLEYVAEALSASGHAVRVLDLCWAEDWRQATGQFFDSATFDVVGLTLRNTDDCAFTSRASFLGAFVDQVKETRRHTDALVVVGGVGFSVMPEHVLGLCDADLGVWGDGEFALAQLADRMERGADWLDVPNLVRRHGGAWHRNPASAPDLADLPRMTRTWVDNGRYFREGGQAGIETKRGCCGRCTYCADPLAKGQGTRLRPPEAVVSELESLLEQGIDHVHTCDSEFNLPQSHARAVCEAIIRHGLGDKLRWYAYCSPAAFSPEFALLMARAGCVGINFGADSGDARMLKLLRRDFAPQDILHAARRCRDAGITVMFDLLIGAPGETRESIVRTVELMKQADPDRVGVAAGLRVYPGTELAVTVAHKDLAQGCSGGESPSDPLFFMEPAVKPFVFELLDDLIGDDGRFFFFDPARPDRNYNCNANQVLVDAIREGRRGAYWDILRRRAT